MIDLYLTFLLAECSAATSDESEEVEQMLVLAEHRDWTSFERRYQQNYAILGRQAPPELLELAASAAKSRGDIMACRERLSALNELWPSPAHELLLHELDAEYGNVTIRGNSRLTPFLSFDIDHWPLDSTAVEFANQQLLTTATFRGMLPVEMRLHVHGLCDVPFIATSGASLDLDLTRWGRWTAACRAAGTPGPGEISAPTNAR